MSVGWILEINGDHEETSITEVKSLANVSFELSHRRYVLRAAMSVH